MKHIVIEYREHSDYIKASYGPFDSFSEAVKFQRKKFEATGLSYSVVTLYSVPTIKQENKVDTSIVM